MARHDLGRRQQESARASRDPVPMIDHCVAILVLALFLCLLGSVTFATESGISKQGGKCTRDAFKGCGGFIQVPIASPAAPAKGAQAQSGMLDRDDRVEKG